MIALGLAALPQKLLAEIVGFLIETAIIVAITWHFVAAHYELKESSDLAQAQQVAAKKYADDDKKYNDIAAQLETAKAKNQIVYETINHQVEHIVDRPVYLHDCVDSDGLLDINAALAGKLPPLPPSLLQPCPPLQPLVGTTGADVLRKLVEVGQAYNTCSDSKSALIDAVKTPTK